MTIGQRIAQKRKELGLSQEALGEKLGVSRQSIYKWESDGALPEIDKLIALSRLFGLSVGGLLGVEEAQLPAAEADTAEDASGLTDAQLRMVEEITRRYLDAVPQKTSRRLIWPFAAVILSCVCIVAAVTAVSARLDRMEWQYHSLQSSLSSVDTTVDERIGSITEQVESLLKEQNALTSDYAAQVVSTDPAQNTVTFSFRATPKTFTEGTVAYLEVSGEAAAQTFGPYEPISNQTFIGEVTVPLKDDIRLSVIFETDGVRFTQLLGEFTGLYTQSLPSPDGLMAQLAVNFYGGAMGQGKFYTKDLYAYYPQALEDTFSSISFGLFLNRTLLGWAESCDIPEGYSTGENAARYAACRFFRLPDQSSRPYEVGDEIVVAALVEDQYGRRAVHVLDGATLTMRSDGFGSIDFMTHPPTDLDPARWGL